MQETLAALVSFAAWAGTAARNPRKPLCDQAATGDETRAPGGKAVTKQHQPMLISFLVRANSGSGDVTRRDGSRRVVLARSRAPSKRCGSESNGATTTRPASRETRAIAWEQRHEASRPGASFYAASHVASRVAGAVARKYSKIRMVLGVTSAGGGRCSGKAGEVPSPPTHSPHPEQVCSPKLPARCCREPHRTWLSATA